VASAVKATTSVSFTPLSRAYLAGGAAAGSITFDYNNTLNLNCLNQSSVALNSIQIKSSLTTSTIIDKDILDKNHHIDFYIKNYLEKYLSTFLVRIGRHKIKVVCNKVMKREIYEENITHKDNIYLITYSEESIINGKDHEKFSII
jgi:hypothetical protein